MDHHIRLIERLHELWNTGDVGSIDQIYAVNFVAHWPASSEKPSRFGVEGAKSGIIRIREAFPDWREDIVDIFGAGDKVVTRYISSGTHLGPFWGIEATGRKIKVQEMSIYRISSDRVAEQWCLFDELSRLQQLGVDELYLMELMSRMGSTTNGQ